MPDPSRFDLDPEALAWARQKVQHDIDKLSRFHREATAAGKPEQGEMWRRMANHMKRTFIGGEGCTIAYFDERRSSLMSGQPVRIQRRRTKGWRKPEGAVYVGRGTRWGNPCTQVRYPALDGTEWEHEGRLGKTSGQHHGFVHPDKTITSHLVKDATREQAVALFREWIAQRPSLAQAARTELTGRDLMCWCKTTEPCHADVLLEISNG